MGMTMPEAERTNQTQTPAPAAKSRLRWLVWLCLLIAVGLGGYLLARAAGWFRSSPGRVLKQSLELAGRGEYDAATDNLTADVREFLRKRPELKKAIWDTVTQGG